MKVIKSLQNRGILLKGTTRKITSQKGGILNFLRPLMTAGFTINEKFTQFTDFDPLLIWKFSVSMSLTFISKKVFLKRRLAILNSSSSNMFSRICFRSFLMIVSKTDYMSMLVI